MSSNARPERRHSPLRSPGGAVHPSVQAALKQTARLVGDAETKVTVRGFPVTLADAIRAEATRLTGHGRRGFSDLLLVLVQVGWEAYQRGEIEIELRPTAVEQRIALARR